LAASLDGLTIVKARQDGSNRGNLSKVTSVYGPKIQTETLPSIRPVALRHRRLPNTQSTTKSTIKSRPHRSVFAHPSAARSCTP
jgi:hypothetical protein